MWVRWICHRGAAGNGAVYERNNLVGMAVAQLSIGFQAGQNAWEVIFFESETDMERFKIINLSLQLKFRQAVTSGHPRISSMLKALWCLPCRGWTHV
jgi:hypothetical protein